MALTPPLPGWIVNLATTVLKEELNKFREYDNNVKSLKEEIKNLKNARQKVDDRAREDEIRHGREIYDDVIKWLSKAQSIISEYEKFDEEDNRIRAGCFVGFPLNVLAWYSLCQTAIKLKGEVVTLLKDGKFDIISRSRGPPKVALALSNVDFQSFDSRKAAMEDIIKALKDLSARMIGVYGLSGVGKTTLVMEAVNRVQNDPKNPKLFDVVIMANLTKTPDIRKIQGQIADMLWMKLEEESEEGRAARIRERLKNEKESTLIILDDICATVDLNILGIPWESGDGNQKNPKGEKSPGPKAPDKNSTKQQPSALDAMLVQKGAGADVAVASTSSSSPVLTPGERYKGCKVLLISEVEQVLNQMEVRPLLHVDVLDENEANTLFNKMAGIGYKNSEFGELPAQIVKRCDRLPMSIVTIAKALKNRTPSFWENTLKKLETQTVARTPEHSTRMIYDLLESEELQLTFLLCAFMGNDALISELVRLCIGLGFLDLQGIYTARDARTSVQIMLMKLREANLLSNSYSTDRFTMQNLVRNAAFSIASKEKPMLMLTKRKIDEWPDDDELKRYVAISLRHCDLTEGITKKMACNKIKILEVKNNDPHLTLPNEFFKQMEELKVLILTGVHLSPLDSSMECLTKLRMLCIEHCTLIPSNKKSSSGKESSLREELGVIEKLKNLRILSFSGSNIDCLPVELGNLSKLQTLDISNCPKLSVITPNVISRLTTLEELYMRKTPIQWPKVINGGENNKSEKASLSELGSLNQLTNLDIQIKSVDHLSENLFFDKVSSYKIVIGSSSRYLEKGFKMPEKHELSRFLAIHQKGGIPIHSHKGIKMLFERVEYLLLGKLTGVEDIFYDLNLKGFPHLKELAIRNNHYIQFLVKSPPELGHQHPDEKAFVILETLELYKVAKMKKICFSSRSLSKPSFENLKTIKINFCENLECLFSISMLELLTALETIQASDCGSLEEIIADEITDGDESKYGKLQPLKLRTLTLQSLPKFIGFDPIAPRDDTKILFHEKVDVSKLERIELRSIQIQKIWNDRSSNFENLIHLDVSGCHNLTYLLPYSLARNLKKLQSLYVSECDQIQDIFFPDGAPVKVAKDVFFPNLKNIKLSSMSSLTKIWNLNDPRRAVDMFEKLETLVIENCKKLVSVFDQDMKGMFQGLSRLTVTNCASMKTIFNLTDDQNRTELQDVHLESLPKLEKIFKGILQLKSLQNMTVHDCKVLENIFPFSVAVERRLEKLQCLVVSDCSELKGIVAAPRDTRENRAIKFSELTSVKISNLPKFENFCPGHSELKCEKLDDVSIKHCGRHELFREEANQATTSATNGEEATTSVTTAGEANTSAQRKPLFLEEVLNQLKSMHIELQHISSSFTHYRLDKLEVLGLSQLRNTKILYNFLHSSPNLNSLWLDLCSFNKLVEPESKSPGDGIGIKGVVPKLKTLKLTNLHYLEEIGFEHDPILQRIESLILENCPSLETIVPSKESVCFTFLTKLEVVNCKSMKYLMPLSTAKSLGQLVTMKVTNCKSLEQIIIVSDHQEGEESEKESKIVFKQMQTLELVSLKNLASFCSSKSFTLEFPLLEKFVASACPKMKKFSGKDIKTAPTILQKVYFVPDEEKRLCWEGDLPATIDHIYKNQKYFEGMDKISVSEHSVLEERWKSENALDKGWFYSLKILTLEGCKFDSCAILWFVLRYLNSLKELKVRKCINITSIFEMDENTIKGTFQLEKLTLEELPNVAHVWPQQYKQKDSCFPNLQQVTVNFCRRLKALFPVAIATNLKKLEQLAVYDCDELGEIVEKVEGGDAELSCVFSCLVQLNLYNLPQLTHFYDGNFTLECHKLKTLDLFNCNKFELFHHKTPEEINSESESRPSIVRPSTNIKDISKVEAMSMKSKDASVLYSWLQGSENDKLEYLRALRLDFDDEGYSNYSTSAFEILRRTANLERIIIINSTSHEKIPFLPQNSSNGQDRFLEQLESLFLFCLLKLSSFKGLESLPKLQELYVYHCPHLETIEQYPPNLKKLNVAGCDRLQYLFISSAARTLKHLENLYVEGCKSLKDIVRKGPDDETATEEIIFERLRIIWLQNLESLECFYSGNTASKLPSLYRARIWKCPKMTIFSKELRDVNFSIPVNSAEGTQLSNQESLDLNEYPELQVKWFGSSEISLQRYFGSLKSLEVEGCEFLTNAVLPSHIFPLLCNLEELTVKKCKNVEAIFDVNDTLPEHDDPKKNIKIPLWKIILEELPTLKHVWNNDPKEASLSFPSLKRVFVKECKRITSLFHPSVPRDNLEHLDVRNCGELVEIVGKDEAFARDANNKEVIILFPKLAWLVLRDLPKLRCICYGMHSLLDCSTVLTRLYVYRCPLLKVFAANIQNSNQEGEDCSATDDGKEGFVSSTKKDTSGFVELELSKEEVTMIQNGILQVDDFQNLNYLGLNNFNDDESDEFPDAFLSKMSLPKLTEIQLVDCAFKDIFLSKGSDIDYSKMLSQLKYLEIINLYKLNSMGFEHPWMAPLLESLQTLRILECNSLTNLAASHVVCFFSLTALTVENCAGLKYLFTSSTAKSLGALQKLSITKCKSLKTVVAHEEGDKPEDMVSFSKLGTLSLDKLPQLESFYTGNSTLYFSNIYCDSFTITKCNKMKTFSHGDVLPKLLHGKIDEEDPWYGDLNSAVKEHYVKTRATAPTTYLDLPATERSLLLFSFIMLAQSAKGTPKKKQRRTLELPVSMGPPEYNENTSG